MRKVLLCMWICIAASIPLNAVRAGDVLSGGGKAAIEQYIHAQYVQIDFTGNERLSYDVFAKAYTGYLNLLNEGKLHSDKAVISICDFNLPSTENRLWVIDLASHKVLFNTYVAHGQGSGDDCAMSFSNNFNSHQSSLGFYVTGDTYTGEHGLSLKLNGMDEGFNDAALERGIVVHSAAYVSKEYIAGNERLGRSWGCPAVPDHLKLPIINAIAGGTCLFIYHSDSKYDRTAYWINKQVVRLPDAINLTGFMPFEKK